MSFVRMPTIGIDMFQLMLTDIQDVSCFRQSVFEGSLCYTMFQLKSTIF